MRKTQNKRERVYDDRLPVTRGVLHRMAVEFARKARHVLCDIDEPSYSKWRVAWSDADVLTIYARNARGTLVDLADITVQTAGIGHLIVQISGIPSVARAVRDDLLARGGWIGAPDAPRKTNPIDYFDGYNAALDEFGIKPDAVIGTSNPEEMAMARIGQKGKKITPKRLSIERDRIRVEGLANTHSLEMISEKTGLEITKVRRLLGKKKNAV